MPSAASRLMPTLRRVVLAGTGADRTDGQLLAAFIADRDADAFAGLVHRHGAMVLGVCRRVTGDHAAAEDAFQAVFIVLARRAAAVKPREQVGNWLYGVAYRTALKARAVLARRRSREKQVDVMPEPPVSQRSTADWADLQPIIDEELTRLPDKLRLPVVLCDLEGRAQREVAKQLGLPAATLATRLATARRTLANRLTRRGVTLSGGALAGLLTINGKAPAVAHALTQSVTRAAEAVAAGGAPLVSAHAVQLSEGIMRMMLLTKLKAVAVTALTSLALSGGLGLGLVPAVAAGSGDEPASGDKTAAKPDGPPIVAIDQLVEEKLKERQIDLNADTDDATFLRRLSMDLRGILPTDVETVFFIADEDDNKRGKVVEWMVDDGDVKAFAAKKLGVAADRIRVVRAVDAGSGKVGRIVLVIEMEEKDAPQALAFSPDGTRLAVTLDRDVAPRTARVAPLVLDLDGRLNTYYRRVRTADKPAAVDPARLFLGLRIPADGQTVKQGETLWELAAGDDKGVRVWDAQTGKLVEWLTAAPDDKTLRLWIDESHSTLVVNEPDIDFLKRVVKEARGGAPTALEEKYFAEDKDPKKREKLLDALLKDAAVARKLGDDWKKKMLSAPTPTVVRQPLEWKFHTAPLELKYHKSVPVDPKSGRGQYEFKLDPKLADKLKFVLPADPKSGEGAKDSFWKIVPVAPATPKTPTPPATPATPKPPTDRIEKIVVELLAAKKSDADVHDGISLVVLGRLPTEAEKKLTLGLVAKSADRKAAWLEVAKALAATGESKLRSETTGRRDAIELKGVVTSPDGKLRIEVKPDIRPHVEVKPLPPAKK